MAEELAKALNLSAFPKPYQDLYQVQSKATKDLSDAETSIEKFKLTREADAATQQKKMFDEATNKYQEKLGKEQEKLDSFGDVKFQPTQDNLQDIAGLFSAVGIIGAMIGGSGRNSAMNALSSMTGMLDGWKQGRSDLFKQEKIKFDEELNKIKVEKDSIVQKMNAIAKEYAVDKEKADMDYKVLLAQYPDSVLQQMDKIGGLKATYDFVNNTLTKATDQAVKHNYDMQMEGVRHANRLAEEKVAAGLKEIKDIQPLVEGIRASNDLLNQMQDSDVQKGLAAKAAPLLEKIRSLKDNQDFETAVNSQLTGTDKTTLFLKDALINAYAIERAARGGTRLTVQDVKTLTPVLDPTNYTPEAYRELLERRRKTLYTNLQDRGLTVDQINQRTVERPYTPYSQTTQQTQAPKQAIDYLTKNPTEENKKFFKDKYGYLPQGM
jgi:hypothetical protein